MTSAGTPDRSDLDDGQRTRLEALTEAKTVLGSGYRDPVDLDALERMAVFILDGAETSRTVSLTDKIDPRYDALQVQFSDGTFGEFHRVATHDPHD